MAFASINDFPKKDIEIAAVFKALSHPGRVAILKVLAKKQSCICGDLVADLPLAQSTVSQHLKVLKEVGLVQGQIDGPRSCYCVNKDAIKKMKKLCGALFDFVDKHSVSDKNC